MIDLATLLAATDFEQFLQFLVQGLSQGMLFALIALGYTMVYGIVELINFAHGDLFMLGCMLSLTLIGLLGLDQATPVMAILGLLAMLVAVPAFCAILNVAVDRFVYRPLRRAPKLAPLVSAIGVSFVFMNIGMCWPLVKRVHEWECYPRPSALLSVIGAPFTIPSPTLGLPVYYRRVEQTKLELSREIKHDVPDLIENVNETGAEIAALCAAVNVLENEMTPVEFDQRLAELMRQRSTDSTFRMKDILVIAVTVPIMIGLTLLVKFTRLGKAMRATAQNPTAAQLMGINVNHVISATFAIGGALAGAASVIYGLYINSVDFQMGFQNGLYAFTAAVLGGIGNIPGAVLGGIIIGLVRAIGSGYVSQEWNSALVFMVLIVILVFRPSGLLGSRTREKV